LSGDPVLRRRLGDEGRNQALRRFHWRIIIGEYEKTWATLKALATKVLPNKSHATHIDPSLSSMAAVFSHYPTLTLSDTTSLALSLRGKAVISGDLLLPAVYEDAGPLLPGGMALWVLSSLSARTNTLGGLLAEGQKELSSQDDLLRFAVVWLIKYGLIRVSA